MTILDGNNLVGRRTTCRMCGRPLLDNDDLRKGDPRTDIGGDCLACVYATEKWMRMPRRLRCAEPVFADRAGERPTRPYVPWWRRVLRPFR